jgi:broad specificity phosphatase PhoE
MTAAILACNSSSPNDETNAFTTVLLVRHAEKQLSGDDPGLTEIGTERAAALAHVAGELGVTTIYTTQFLRTRATAEPLADFLGLELNVVTSGDSYAAEMAETIRTQHAGEAVVIVSHSNTVPDIVGELGASPVPVIDDDEYDDLYVVVIAPGGEVQLVPLRYGRETP